MSAPDPSVLAGFTELPSESAARAIPVDTRLVIVRQFLEKFGFRRVRVVKRANGSIDITMTEAS